ncbi:MAG: hypothetical protein ACM3TN_25535 [Alphaproteobacteria bacterium]
MERSVFERTIDAAVQYRAAQSSMVLRLKHFVEVFRLLRLDALESPVPAARNRGGLLTVALFTAIGGLAIFFVFFATAPLLAVPALPNESLVTAEVMEQDIVDSTTLKIEPKQALCLLKLRLIKIEAVQKKANFLAGYEGKSIEALSREAPAISGLAGKTIKAHVSFRGDEKSGRYWLVGLPETDIK